MEWSVTLGVVGEMEGHGSKVISVIISFEILYTKGSWLQIFSSPRSVVTLKVRPFQLDGVGFRTQFQEILTKNLR